MNNLLSKNKKNIKIPKKDIDKGYIFLKSLGINKKDKYVCLGIRDENYLKKSTYKDYSRHDYRNCSIKNFESAIKYLLKNNYYVIRMGRYPRENLKISDNKYFDYSNSDKQSDFLDIFLPSRCFLFIGTSFGLDAVPQVFRRPLLSVSVAPFSYISTFQKNFMYI